MYTVYIISTICWTFLNFVYLYYNANNKKLASNFTSATHATSVVFAYLLGIPGQYLFYASCGYYCFDGILNFYEFIFTKRLQNFLMIFHHFISIYGLSCMEIPELYHHVYYAFFLIEVSNFPIYVIYHLKTIKYSNQCIIILVLLSEILMSFICRMVFGLKHCIHAYTTTHGYGTFIIVLGTTLYSLSGLWLFGMCLQLKAIIFSSNQKRVLDKKIE